MGTSLFGLKPKNTYQALLKTTANTAIDATLRTISDGLGNDTPLQLSLRRVGVLTDTSVTTQVSSVIEATTLNASLVIAPNGTGALIADIPDGTVTGGNARGTNAVDLQLGIRDNSNQVASGIQSVIINGTRNRTNNTQASVVNGDLNLASGSQSFIGNGSGNTASGERSFIGNGFLNTASSQYAIVLGGESNTASSGTHATISGGQSNTASNQHATVIGGFTNVASGNTSIAGGVTNVASGIYSVALGATNTASGPLSVSIGANNLASGTNSVTLGTSNTSNSPYATVSGGQTNVASGTHSVVGGGINNICSGEYGVVVGGNGNISSSRRGFVGGGSTNTASGIFNNSVIGGNSCVSSGGESIAGGFQSIASGGRSVAFGLYGTASGGGAFAMGGTASGGGSVAFAGGVSSNTNVFTHGDESSSSLYGSLTKANGRFTSSVISNNGRAQTHSLVARREASLTSGSTTILSLDGTGTSNFIDLIASSVNNGQAFNVKISYIAIVTAISGTATGLNIGDVKTQNIEIGIKSVFGLAPTLLGAGNYSVAQEDASMATAILTPSALVNYLNLTFTAPTFLGGGTVTFRVVSQVEIVEVRYGN